MTLAPSATFPIWTLLVFHPVFAYEAASGEAASGEAGSGSLFAPSAPPSSPPPGEAFDVYMIVAIVLLSIIGCLLLVRLLMFIATCTIYKEEVLEGGSRKPTLKIEGVKVCGPPETA